MNHLSISMLRCANVRVNQHIRIPNILHVGLVHILGSTLQSCIHSVYNTNDRKKKGSNIRSQRVCLASCAVSETNNEIKITAQQQHRIITFKSVSCKCLREKTLHINYSNHSVWSFYLSSLLEMSPFETMLNI